MKESVMQSNLRRIRRSLHMRMDGGPGSGNWGHEGRPGERGGSAEGGGLHNRQTIEKGFSSFSKERAKAAKMHKLTDKDIKAACANSDIVIAAADGNHYQVLWDGYTFKCCETGKIGNVKIGMDAKVIIPNSLNPNYKFTREDKAAMAVNKDRMDKSFAAETRQDADNKHREQSGNVWKGLSEKQKDDLYSYTGSGYTHMNEALREGNTDDKKTNREISNITRAINKSALGEDTILNRGIDSRAAEKMFGLPHGYLDMSKHADPGNVSLVGRVGTDDAFMSTGAAKGTGFGHKNVQLEIMAPKGTKALYCEPFSACGAGAKRGWDGESRQSHIGRECEVLLNRGCTFQVIGHEYDKASGTHKLKVALIKQDPKSSPYSKKLAEQKKKK